MLHSQQHLEKIDRAAKYLLNAGKECEPIESSGMWLKTSTRCNINIFLVFFPAPLPSPGRLQEVEVPIVANSECEKVYKGLITDNHICAGPAGGGKGVCAVSLQNATF